MKPNNALTPAKTRTKAIQNLPSRTIALGWTPGARLCLNSSVVGPAALIAGV